MKTNKLSKGDKKILKTIKITVGSNGSVSAIFKTDRYDAYWRKLKTATHTITLSIDASPTSNCQMASIRGFNNQIDSFEFLSKQRKKELTKMSIRNNYTVDTGVLEEKNCRIRRLAILKLFYTVKTRITGKKLFFIDIPVCYIDAYYVMHPYIFKKRNASREVRYTSTNGNKLMYSLVELDPAKVDMYG